MKTIFNNFKDWYENDARSRDLRNCLIGLFIGMLMLGIVIELSFKITSLIAMVVDCFLVGAILGVLSMMIIFWLDYHASKKRKS